MEPKLENEHGQKPETPGLSIWLRVFIVVNIVLMAGVFAWWVKGFTQRSEAEYQAEKAQQSIDMATMIANNPQPKATPAPSPEPVSYTLDATSLEKWVHFSFARVNQFAERKIAGDSLDWDIVFRRAKILTNGGATGKNGKAEVTVVLGVDFDKVTAPPAEGYLKDIPTENFEENSNPALEKWYEYDFWSHKLKPKKVVYVMKTATGEYVKFRLADYYCGGASGCYTMEFAFLPSGGAGR